MDFFSDLTFFRTSILLSVRSVKDKGFDLSLLASMDTTGKYTIWGGKILKFFTHTSQNFVLNEQFFLLTLV